MDRYRTADRIDLAVTRLLAASDLFCPLERAAVLHLLSERLIARRDRDLRAARRDDSVSYGRIGGVLGISRQAARRRYSDDETTPEQRDTPT